MIRPMIQLLQTQTPGGGGLLAFAPMIFIFVIFYFLLIMPMRKKQKKTQEMLSKLKKGDEDEAIRRFQSDVVRSLGRLERDYPRLARDRGWEGSTMVRVEIGPDGLLKDVSVIKSSGYSVLDDRAVSKVREIRLPSIPDALRDRTFSVYVPFKFSLKTREQ